MVCPGGKNNTTTINATHATAIAPTGTAQRPSVNGPGLSLSLPEVILRKIGAAYDVYSPMTDALGGDVRRKRRLKN